MGNKKIKITESQYKRILNLLVEAPFNNIVNNIIQVGDIITISHKNSKNNFKVLDNLSGHITMDNVDKKSININFRYYVVSTSLNGSSLSLKRVNKVKDKDKLDNPDSWETTTINDITNFQISRDGSVIDSVDGLGVSNEINSEEVIGRKIGYLLDNLTEGKGVKIAMKNTFILFCCVSRTQNIFELEISKNNSFPKLSEWDNFSLTIKGNGDDEDISLFEQNKDIFTASSDNSSFTMKIKAFRGTENKTFNLSGVVEVGVTGSCDKEDVENDKDTENNKEVSPEEEKEKLEKEGKETYQRILSDPFMKKAFYSQPTFWQSFVSELKGEKSPGNGIITAMNMVNRYTETKLSEEIGIGFNYSKGTKIKFTPTRPITINYKKNNSTETLELNTDKEITGEIAKNSINGLTFYVNIDEIYKLRVIVVEKTELENKKKCKLSVGRLIYDQFTKSSEEKDESLLFLKSKGYTQPNNN
jgi:hypothetical protein